MHTAHSFELLSVVRQQCDSRVRRVPTTQMQFSATLCSLSVCRSFSKNLSNIAHIIFLIICGKEVSLCKFNENRISAGAMQTVKPVTKLELPLRFVWYRQTQVKRSQTEVFC